MTFVSIGALGHDTSHGTRHAQEIAAFAATIPEDSIPECPENAAKVFLAYCLGETARPFRWMFPKDNQ